MSSRSSRKRPALMASASPMIEPPTRKSRREIVEVETLQAELEHERSLRAIDSKRFVQSKQRLETQLKFAAEENQEQKSLLEELREEHDKHLQQLRSALKRTKEDLLEAQADLDEERAMASEQELEENPLVTRLQEDLQAQSTENDQLRDTIAALRKDLQEMMEKENTASNHQAKASDSISEARPEVLQELNKVRIQLAESERKTRQYKRIAEEAAKKSKDAIQIQEKLRASHKRTEQLESELKDTSLAKETLQESLRKWQQELGSVMATFGRPKADLSVLRQYVNDMNKREQDAETKSKNLKTRLEKSETRIQTLEAQANSFARKETAWNTERKQAETQKQHLEQQIKVLQGQEGVYKREVESLRSIVKTFDDLPIGGSKAPPANLQLVEARFQAARDQVELLKQANEGLQTNLASSTKETQDLQNKHNTVLEKFGKLRDALYAERAKAEKAMERANEAEILAGKGSFNPNTTRVLHFSNNPLTMALKDEIVILKKQVEVLSNGNKNLKKSYATDVDPNKLHQRLKQSFKEQISRFREGVYLMTGYKVRTDWRPSGVWFQRTVCSFSDTHSFQSFLGRHDSRKRPLQVQGSLRLCRTGARLFVVSMARGQGGDLVGFVAHRIRKDSHQESLVRIHDQVSLAAGLFGKCTIDAF